MTRHLAHMLVAATLATAAAVGCTTTVPGTALPSVCAKHELTDCLDYQPTPPVGVDEIFHVDRITGAQMLCTAVSDDQLALFFQRRPIARYISTAGQRCSITTDDTGSTAPRHTVQLGLWPAPMQGYEIVPGNTRTDIAGLPAWDHHAADGVREERESTISTTGDPHTGGVMFVTSVIERPRGDLTTGPLDASALDHHREIAEIAAHAIVRSHK